jgi:type II secretory pathway pseudopilin PulG
MSRRGKMTPIEFLILMAIVGILISIILPGLSQARRRELAARRHGVQDPALDSRAADGQLNTIEVSEVAQNEPTQGPEQYIAPVVRLLPLAAAAFFVFLVLTRLRRQMSERSES